MVRRLIFGPILILLLLGLALLDDAVAGTPLPEFLRWTSPDTGEVGRGALLLVFGMAVCGLGGIELARLFNAVGIRASVKHLMFASAAGVLVGGLTIGPASLKMGGHGTASLIQATASAAVVFLSMLAYIRDRDLKGAAGAVAASVFAFVYMGVVIGFVLAIRREHGVFVMAAAILTIKSSDIGAFFTGVAVGSHKLIPWISPGKTWEGFAGGVVTSALVGIGCVLAGQAWGGAEDLAHMPWWFGAVLGLLLGAAGQAGDLSASVLKRDAGLKDAGRLLPGFGGVVDMLDSLVIAGPLAYWGLTLAAVIWPLAAPEPAGGL
jgi:phosphatidate cytidylyltransferase